jgi:hypothetical protein
LIPRGVLIHGLAAKHSTIFVQNSTQVHNTDQHALVHKDTHHPPYNDQPHHCFLLLLILVFFFVHQQLINKRIVRPVGMSDKMKEELEFVLAMGMVAYYYTVVKQLGCKKRAYRKKILNSSRPKNMRGAQEPSIHTRGLLIRSTPTSLIRLHYVGPLFRVTSGSPGPECRC